MDRSKQETMMTPLVWQPQTAADAWRYKQAYGLESAYVSGGTLLRTQWEAGTVQMPIHLIDLSRIHGLKEIRIGGSGLIVGGQTLLQDCRMNSLVQRHFPMVTESIRVIAAPSIRNLATIGGNIASLIGDAIPALLAYDATINWFNGVSEEHEKLTDWMSSSSEPGFRNERLLLNLEIPISQSEALVEAELQQDAISKKKRFSAYHKVGRREAFTPSVVTVAVCGSITETNLLHDFRVAVGGGQTIANRFHALEKEVEGCIVDEVLLRHLYIRVLELYEPRADLLASASYRKQAAANLIVTELWKAVSGHTP